MRIPGFDRREEAADRTSADPVYVERRRGESTEAFEARLADLARERSRPAAGAREAEAEAYAEGRRDQRRADRPAPAAGLPPERDGAYEAGRRDQRRIERAHDRRHMDDRQARRGGGLGLLGVAIAIVALLGVLWVVLAVREGSFAGGGALVDQKIAQVSRPVRTAANEAVDRTGEAVQSAGQAIEGQGERIRDAAQ